MKTNHYQHYKILLLIGIFLLVSNLVYADTKLFQEGLSGYTNTRDIIVHPGSPDMSDNFHIVFVDYPDLSSSDSQQHGAEALLKFGGIFGSNTQQIPLGSKINRATLTLYTPSTEWAPGNGGIFHRMLVSWNESSTWNSLNDGIQATGIDAVSGISFQVGSSYSITGEGTYSFDVTSDVAIWSDGAVNEGWVGLPWTYGTDGWGFAGREWEIQSQRPSLSIVYEPVPEPATLFLLTLGGLILRRRK
jgi:hypothetical protein